MKREESEISLTEDLKELPQNPALGATNFKMGAIEVKQEREKALLGEEDSLGFVRINFNSPFVDKNLMTRTMYQ